MLRKSECRVVGGECLSLERAAAAVHGCGCGLRYGGAAMTEWVGVWVWRQIPGSGAGGMDGGLRPCAGWLRSLACPP